MPEVAAPVYSHLAYDIVPREYQVVRQPDVVIVEGLNVLQTGGGRAGRPMPSLDVARDASIVSREAMFVSDFFDLDLRGRERSGHRAVVRRAVPRTCVTPCSRIRRRMILEKGRDHAVRRVKLRKP